MTVEQEWLGTAEVAQIFGVSKRTVYDAVYRAVDPIPHGHFGGKLLFNKAEVEVWVRRDRSRTPAVEKPTPAPVVRQGRRGPKPGRGSVADLFG